MPTAANSRRRFYGQEQTNHMPIVTANGDHVKSDIDDLLGSFATPDEIRATLNESSYISALRVADAIAALAPVANDLDYRNKLKMIHSLDSLIAEIPKNERDPVKLAVLNILKTGKSADDFMAEIPAPVKQRFTPYSFDDLMTMPEKEWIIDQVIGPGDICVLYGAPGCGKTFVGINLIVAACTGVQWAGRFGIARPLNVAYCAGEGFSGLPARFRAATVANRITNLPNFTFFRAVPQLHIDKESLTEITILQFVAEWKERQANGEVGKLDVIVIDTLSTASIGAEENSNTDMNKIAKYCRWASNELGGCATMLVHHTGKNGETERGATALRGAADCMIHIKRKSDTGTTATMICSKLKDGEQWKDQTFDLHTVDGCNSVCVLWDEPSDGTASKGQKAEDKAAILAEMDRYAGTRFTSKRLAEAIAKSDNYARNLLSELEKAGECKRELSDPSKGPSPRNPWVYFV